MLPKRLMASCKSVDLEVGCIILVSDLIWHPILNGRRIEIRQMTYARSMCWTKPCLVCSGRFESQRVLQVLNVGGVLVGTGVVGTGVASIPYTNPAAARSADSASRAGRIEVVRDSPKIDASSGSYNAIQRPEHNSFCVLYCIDATPIAAPPTIPRIQQEEPPW